MLSSETTSVTGIDIICINIILAGTTPSPFLLPLPNLLLKIFLVLGIVG